MNPLNKYLLSAYSVSGTISGTEDVVINKTTSTLWLYVRGWEIESLNSKCHITDIIYIAICGICPHLHVNLHRICVRMTQEKVKKEEIFLV